MTYYNKIDVEINDVKNELDVLSNYTYHFRLFMMNEVQFRLNHYDLSKTPQITLVESGATSFSFENIEIEGFIGGNAKTASAQETTFNIKILEPQSATFIDYIYWSSVELGIENFHKHPFFLEVYFVGYDDEGNIINVGTNPSMRWNLLISSIEVSVDAGGTVYELSGFNQGSLGVTEEYGVIPEDVTPVGNTIPEFLRSLEDEWNAFEVDHFLEGALTPLKQYKFLLYENVWGGNGSFDWNNMRLIEEFPGNSTQRSESRDKLGRRSNSTAGTFSKGWRIQNVIDTLFSISNYAQEVREKLGVVDEPEDITFFAKTYRIEPQVLYSSYNPKINNFNKVIVFHIWPYDLSSIVHRPVGVDNKEQDNLARAKEIINHMVDFNLIKKKYSYIYTGKNTEIENFNIRYNHLWYGVMNLINGKYSTSSVTTGTSSPLFRQEGQKIRISDPTHQKAVTSATQLQQDRNRQQDTLIRAQQAGAQVQAPSPRALQGSIDRANEAQSRVDVASEQLVAQQEYLRKSEEIKFKHKFAEDLNRRMEHSMPPIPLSVQENAAANTKNTESGLDTPLSRKEGRMYMQSIFEQIYGTTLADWMHIELDIRGDPFWMGRDNLERSRDLLNVALQAIDIPANELAMINKNVIVVTRDMIPEPLLEQIQQDIPEKPVLNFELGEHYIFLEFNTPNLKENPESLPDERKFMVDLFTSGIYRITQVHHVFSEGKFTQKITGYRHMFTSPFILNSISKESKILQEKREQHKPNQPIRSVRTYQNENEARGWLETRSGTVRRQSTRTFQSEDEAFEWLQMRAGMGPGQSGNQ